MGFNLFKFLQDAGNNVGQAVDNVVPGNQGFLHSTPSKPQPASTAPVKRQPNVGQQVFNVAHRVASTDIPGLGVNLNDISAQLPHAVQQTPSFLSGLAVQQATNLLPQQTAGEDVARGADGRPLIGADGKVQFNQAGHAATTADVVRTALADRVTFGKGVPFKVPAGTGLLGQAAISGARIAPQFGMANAINSFNTDGTDRTAGQQAQKTALETAQGLGMGLLFGAGGKLVGNSIKGARGLGEDGFLTINPKQVHTPVNPVLPDHVKLAVADAGHQIQQIHNNIAQHQSELHALTETIQQQAIPNAQKQTQLRIAEDSANRLVNAEQRKLATLHDHISTLDPTGQSRPITHQVDIGATGTTGQDQLITQQRAARPLVDKAAEAVGMGARKLTDSFKKDILGNEAGSIDLGAKVGKDAPKPENFDDLLKAARKENLPAENIPVNKAEAPKRNPQSLNTERLNISKDAKGEVNALSQADPITHMKDSEVQALAKNAGIDSKSHTIDQTRQKVSEQLNLRQKIVQVSNQADQLLADGKIGERQQLMKQIQELSRTSTEQGTDIARQLSARRILANELDTPMQRVFKLLDKDGVNPDVVAEKFAKVDFNDANAVVKAYRELVPPTKGNWLDTIRYNSMLSSPLTQINNIFPNIESTAAITPVEKTLTGLLDVAHSALTGKPRQFAVGEGAAYAKGYFSSFGEAKRRFSESLSGKTEAANLDMKGHVPMYAHGQNKAYDILSFPMRMMEAMDGFFTGLTEGGVSQALETRSKAGIKTPNIANQSGAESAYRLYRQELGDKSQGKFLQAMDIPAQKLMELRNSKNPYVSYPAKFTVPFVRTTMNIFKQGFEYSPAGVLTLHGATNKTEQLSKMLLGTAVVGTAGSLLGQNRLTWAQPTNAKQLDAWKTAGMQPYSVKIGNTWVSFQKLPPALSFNLALVAALDDAQKNAKINQNGIDNVMGALAKYGQFLSDQSYTKSAGNFLKAVQGDGQAVTQLAASYPQQLIPFRALSNWFANMTDDTQRKINKDNNFAAQQVEALMQVIPGLRQKTTAVTDPNGQPVPAQHPVVNAFSPLKVSTENAAGADYYNMLKQTALNNANDKITKADGKQPTGGNKILDQANARIKTATEKLPTGISKPSSDTLTNYAKLNENGKAKFNADPANKLKLNRAQYEQNKLSGKLTGPKDLAAQQSLAKEAITSKYSQDVLDFYSLSNTQKRDYIAKDPTGGKALLAQSHALDSELTGKTGAQSRYDKSGNIKIAKVKGAKKAKAIGGAKKNYNFTARLSAPKGYKPTALRSLLAHSKLGTTKAPKLAMYKSTSSKITKKARIA